MCIRGVRGGVGEILATVLRGGGLLFDLILDRTRRFALNEDPNLHTILPTLLASEQDEAYESRRSANSHRCSVRKHFN